MSTKKDEEDPLFRFMYAKHKMETDRNLKPGWDSISKIRKEYENENFSTKSSKIKYAVNNKLLKEDDISLFPVLNYDIINSEENQLTIDENNEEFRNFVNERKDYYKKLEQVYAGQENLDQIIKEEMINDFYSQLEKPNTK